jgi:hypothetical protein
LKIKTIKLKNVCLIIFSFLIVSSCTIQKKLHSNGYHVEWKSWTQKKSTKAPYEDSEITEFIRDSTQSEVVLKPLSKKSSDSLCVQKNILNLEKTHKNKSVSINVIKEHLLSKLKGKTDYKRPKNRFYRNNSTATSNAIFNHLGFLLIIMGFLLIFNSSAAINIAQSILFFVIGSCVYLYNLLVGLRNISYGNLGNLPLFAQITLYSYLLVFLFALVVLFINYE